MSDVELLEAQGSAWSYLLSAVLVFGLPLAAAWIGLHGGPHLLAAVRRGRAYRARIRAARHARPHLTFRSPVR